MSTPSSIYAAAVNSAALFDFTNHGKIEVTGPDAAMFLHNLCTNDIKNLSVGAQCEAFFTTAKARVVAHVTVHHRGESFLLTLEPGRAGTLLKTLDHYLISEQVTLADRTDILSVLRLVGPRSLEMAGQALATPLEDLTPGHGKTIAGVDVWRLADISGLDFICVNSEAADLRERLRAAGALLGEVETWDVLRIEAGLPVFGKDIDDQRLVMEVNRTRQAICYTKGCFLGQEPIVMARDRGQVNRLLMGIQAATNQTIEAKKLFQGEQEVGQVTSTTFSPRLVRGIGLAYLRRGAWDPGTTLHTETGQTVTVCQLPFAQPQPRFDLFR